MSNNHSPKQYPYEIILSSGQKHFDALINDIRHAKHSIDIETYIYSNDDLGKRITNELIQAAQRGVKVRVLVDGAGCPFWSTTFAKSLEKAGANTRVFHPFPWHLWNWSRSVVRLPLLMKWIYLLLKINFRNHRKVCLIDQQIAFIGSVNISQCHLSKQAGGAAWRDTSVRLSETNLTDLCQAFDNAWHHRSIPERLRAIFREVRNDPIIRLNYTRHRRRILYKNLLRKVAGCQKRIWITNAYFVPDNFLLRKLKETASRGVDVRILLPKHSDVMMMPWASCTFYYSLLKSGVRIFEYLPSVLHAKILILDEWMLIGSSNLNHRSLLHDLEVDVNITRPQAKAELSGKFLRDLGQSREIALDSWKHMRPWHQRMMGRLVLYIKYWI